MTRAWSAWLAVVCLVVALVAPAAAQPIIEKRVALVIGIGDYRDPLLGKLDHPKSDAASIAQELKQLGFEVVTELDLTKQELSTALDRFAREHQTASAVLVYFTGHGIQIGGQNFLLPVDANFDTAASLRSSAVPLEAILIRAAKVAPRRIILLDACRDDPTQRARTILKDPTLPILSGLGRVGRADNTIVAFSTAPGATAEDGGGDHSPFAQALLAHLGEKGLEFGAVMKLVQMEVYDRTPEHQLPYVEDALPALIFAAPREGSDLPERDRLLLAMAKIDPDTRAQVERIAKVKNVPLAPLYGSLFAGATLTNDPDGEMREKLLMQAADDFVSTRNDLQTLASSDPEVARLRSEAEHDLSLGALDAARSALTRAIDVDHAASEALEERLRTRKLSEAASRAARAGVERTHLAYRDAARDLSTAADLAEYSDAQQAWRYALEAADNLRALGGEFGDNAALLDAIGSYRNALRLAPHEERPLDWAITQNHFGRALATLGWRESGTARLEAAVAVDREALGEFERQGARLDWARTQTNLGNVLVSLGERESGTARFEQAVAAFREAAREQTREAAPFDWAKTQASLAIALWRLGEREVGTAHLLEAVAADREALKELTRERMPLDWAEVQHDLGVALCLIGQRESDTSNLEQAVAAFQEALKERTRARVPVAWASSEHNLAKALAALGAREPGTARLEEAVAANREALKELRRDREPVTWARTQASLGNMLTALGQREGGTRRVEEAVTALQAAVTTYTRGDDALDWAGAQLGLANALSLLGQRESGTAQLEAAVVAYRKALEEDTRERVPRSWTAAQIGLGYALMSLGQRRTGTDELEQAVVAFRDALKEETRERVPLGWAIIQADLGNALMSLGHRQAGTDRLEEAVAAFREALQEETRERLPLAWAAIQNNLGDALTALGGRETGTAELEQAVAAFREALKEDTRERVPLLWAATENNLGNALALLGQRETGTDRLEEAVDAFRQALDEHTHQQTPTLQARNTGNEGVALMLIAQRRKDGSIAATACSRIETAIALARSAGDDSTAAYFETQLAQARTLHEQLR
jgi:uncharacterized caspase-like protein/uncharacterized protein YqhQ